MNNNNKDNIRISFIKCNMAYQDELDNINRELTEKEISDYNKQINKYIKDLNISEKIKNNDEFILLLTLIFGGNYKYDIIELTTDEINERYEWYLEGYNFFLRDDAFDIIDKYGAIIPLDSKGNLTVDSVIIDKILQEYNLRVSDSSDIKDIINETWDDKSKMITCEGLDNFSEIKNGLAFKYYLFCEEYLKKGKIKPTCEGLGIARNTAYLWLKDKKVIDYLNSRKQEIKDDIKNSYMATYSLCFDELSHIINSDYVNSDTKIKAIGTFLKHYENIERINYGNISED